MREHIAKTIEELQASVDRGLFLIQSLREFDSGVDAAAMAALPPRENPAAPEPEPVLMREIAHRGQTGLTGQTGRTGLTGLRLEAAAGERQDCGVHRISELQRARVKRNGKVAASPPRSVKRANVPNGMGAKVMRVMLKMGDSFDYTEVADHLQSEALPEQVRGAVAYAYKKGELILVAEGGPGKPARYRLGAAARKKYEKLGLGTEHVTPGVAQADEQSRVSERMAALNRPKSRKEALGEEIDEMVKRRDQARGAGSEEVAENIQREIDKRLVELGDMK